MNPLIISLLLAFSSVQDAAMAQELSAAIDEIASGAAKTPSKSPAAGQESAPGDEMISPNDCDIKTISGAAQTKTGWADAAGRRWTILIADKGFALCVYGDRYIMFPEDSGRLKSVRIENGDILPGLDSERGFYEYRIPAAKAAQLVERYRGADIATLSKYKISYSGKQPVLLEIPGGAGFSAEWDKLLKTRLKNDAVWGNPKAAWKLKKWASQFPASCKPLLSIALGADKDLSSNIAAEMLCSGKPFKTLKFAELRPLFAK